ncbi:hypothetical protein HK100_011983 [Physocladia obscura]|uniref:Uncharacterized protein n=1 Tax=Physocladia obscura TaxID=109957 RepID=A0AAD5T126_9FUNG|nr:hypothetical protein HK100_011983 [Physocladia obscura]
MTSYIRPHPGHAIFIAFLQNFVSLLAMPFQQLLLLRVCAKFESQPDYATCAQRSDVQSEAASWILWFDMTQNIPSFFVLIFAGYFVDKLGHKKALKVGLIEFLIIPASLLSIAVLEFPLYVMLPVSFISGITGGSTLYNLVGSAYIAATTVPAKRTKYYMFEMCAISISLAVGPVFAGYIAKTQGFPTLFSIMFCCAILLAIYVIFVFPDSNHMEVDLAGVLDADRNGGGRDENEKSLPKIFYDSIVSTYSIVKMLFSRRESIAILLILIIYGAIASTTSIMFVLYPTKAFGWDSMALGTFFSFKSVQRTLFLAIGYPLFERISQSSHSVSSNSNSAFNKIYSEIKLLRFSLLIHASSDIMFGISQTSSHFYMATAVSAFGIFGHPTAMSLLSIMAPVHIQGRVFGSVKLFVQVVFLAGAVFSNKFYQHTVQWMPQALFFLVSGTCFVAVGISFIGLRKSGIDDILVAGALNNYDAGEVILEASEETPLLV